RVLLPVDEMRGGLDAHRVRQDARARMRRRAQPHDLRAEVDRPVVPVMRDVVQRDVDRHGRSGVLVLLALLGGASYAATGTRKSRLMPTPSVLTRSRNCVRYACR